MATFREIAEGYAGKLSDALSADGFVRGKFRTAGAVRASRTAATLKWIESDLDQYSIAGQPLTDEERGRILEIAADLLGSSISESVERAAKSASNDSFTDLVDEIDDLLR